jgi:nicotinate-nucleotide adenylyltransferase
LKIGLYFGSFNPVHHGHLLVATYIREAAQLDEVWFIVSPQNPFKKSTDLADEQHRLQMTKLAIEKINYFKVLDVEFQLPKPSYTHITLKKLQKDFTTHQFKLIIGEDNIAKFHEWKEANWIQQNFEILVYGRNEIQDTRHKTQDIFTFSNFKILKLPLMDISSTTIRNRIKENKLIDFFTTENVVKYINEKKIYK